MNDELNQLFALDHVRERGLSSLAEISPASKRELKRGVADGSVVRTPDTVWPNHWRYYRID